MIAFSKFYVEYSLKDWIVVAILDARNNFPTTLNVEKDEQDLKKTTWNLSGHDNSPDIHLVIAEKETGQLMTVPIYNVKYKGALGNCLICGSEKAD